MWCPVKFLVSQAEDTGRIVIVMSRYTVYLERVCSTESGYSGYSTLFWIKSEIYEFLMNARRWLHCFVMFFFFITHQKKLLQSCYRVLVIVSDLYWIEKVENIADYLQGNRFLLMENSVKPAAKVGPLVFVSFPLLNPLVLQFTLGGVPAVQRVLQRAPLNCHLFSWRH